MNSISAFATSSGSSQRQTDARLQSRHRQHLGLSKQSKPWPYYNASGTQPLNDLLPNPTPTLTLSLSLSPFLRLTSTTMLIIILKP